MMLMFALLAIFAAPLLSDPSTEGLYLGSGEVAYFCTAGTPVADKVAYALASCARQVQTYRELFDRRGKRKSKGKGKKCRSMREILEIIDNKYGMHACVYNALGWLDKEGTLNNKTISMDVMSLPQEVSSTLSYKRVAECRDRNIKEMSQLPSFKRCSKNYSKEFLTALNQIEYLIASFQCFEKSLNHACRKYFHSKIVGKASILMTQPDSAGNTVGCLKTCQEENFSWSSFCTEGFTVTRMRACPQIFPDLAYLAKQELQTTTINYDEETTLLF